MEIRSDWSELEVDGGPPRAGSARRRNWLLRRQAAASCRGSVCWYTRGARRIAARRRFGRLSRFRGHPICDRLPRVATAWLHRCSMPASRIATSPSRMAMNGYVASPTRNNTSPTPAVRSSPRPASVANWRSTEQRQDSVAQEVDSAARGEPLWCPELDAVCAGAVEGESMCGYLFRRPGKHELLEGRKLARS